MSLTTGAVTWGCLLCIEQCQRELLCRMPRNRVIPGNWMRDIPRRAAWHSLQSQNMHMLTTTHSAVSNVINTTVMIESTP